MARKFLIGNRVKLTSKLINLDDIFVYSVNLENIATISDIRTYVITTIPGFWVPPSQKGSFSSKEHSLAIKCAVIDFDTSIYQLQYQTEIPEDDEEYENMPTFFCPTVKRWKYVFNPDFSIVKQIVVPIKKLILLDDIILYESLVPGDLVTYGVKKKRNGIVLSNSILHNRKNRLLTNHCVKIFVGGKVKTLSPKTKILNVVK